MAGEPSTVVLPLYSWRAAHPRSRLSYVLVTLALIALGAFYGLMAVFLPLWLIAIPLIPVAILLLLVLWLLPDIDKYDTARMTRAFWIFLAVLIVWPQYIALAIPGLPWINLLRVALFWLMVWFVGAITTSSSLRNEVVATARFSKVFYWAFIVFVAVQWLTIVLSASPLFSLQKAIIQTFLWTSVFFVACHVFLRPGVAMKTVKLLVLGVIFTAVIGMWENAREQIPWANSIPPFLRVDESLLSKALSSQARATDGYYRVRSVFSNTLLFAEFLVVALPFVIHMIVTSRSATFRLISIAAYVLATLGIWVTHSRGGALGWFESHLLYLGIWSIRRLLVRKSDLIAPTLAYGFPAVVIGFVTLTLVWRRLYVMIIGGGATQGSTDARLMQRDMAIPKVIANPFGYGASQSGQVLGYTAPDGTVSIDSYLINLLLDYGVAGFVAYFTMIFSAIYVGFRNYFRVGEDEELQLMGPIAIALCNWAVFKLVLSLEQNQALLFILLGMIAALATRAALTLNAKTHASVMVAPGWQAART